MKILVLSEFGDSAELADALSKDGNAVAYFQRLGPQVTEWQNEMVTVEDGWRPWVDGQDLIICDWPTFSFRLANMGLNGKPVLYLDRGLSYKNLADALVNVPVPAIDFLASLVNGDVEELNKITTPRKRSWWKRVFRRA